MIDNNKVLTGSVNLFERSLKYDRELFMMIESEELNSILKSQFNIMWSDECCEDLNAM